MTVEDRSLPVGATRGRATPTFTSETVPAGLLRQHLTTVWAELTVLCGSVRFFQDTPRYDAVAVPGSPVTIVPNCHHRIKPSDDAEFFVQFYD